MGVYYLFLNPGKENTFIKESLGLAKNGFPPAASKTFMLFVKGPVRKPRHTSVFRTHSDTQAVAFHFATRAFLQCTDTLSTNT